MKYIDYVQLNPFQKFAYNAKNFFKALPGKVAGFFKAIGNAIVKFFFLALARDLLITAKPL